MSGPPFCLQNPSSWPAWLRNHGIVVHSPWPPEASGESTFLPGRVRQRFISTRRLRFLGRAQVYRILRPGTTATATFGIDYNYECDVEERNGEPKTATPQKLTATIDSQRQTKTTHTQTNARAHTHTHTLTNEQVVTAVTLFCEPYVMLAKYLLHADEAQPFRHHLIGDQPRAENELDLKHLAQIADEHLNDLLAETPERRATVWIVSLAYCDAEAREEEAERQARPAE